VVHGYLIPVAVTAWLTREAYEAVMTVRLALAQLARNLTVRLVGARSCHDDAAKEPSREGCCQMVAPVSFEDEHAGPRIRPCALNGTRRAVTPISPRIPNEFAGMPVGDHRGYCGDGSSISDRVDQASHGSMARIRYAAAREVGVGSPDCTANSRRSREPWKISPGQGLYWSGL